MKTLLNPKLQFDSKWFLIDVPEKPDTYKCDIHCWHGEICSCYDYEQALSKAPRWEVKNQEEVNRTIWVNIVHDLCDFNASDDTSSLNRFPNYKDWQPDPTKLYDLPKGYKSELLCFQTGLPCGMSCNGDCENNQVAKIMETQEYFSREDDGALEMMEEFTRKGIFFIEEKATQKWLTSDSEHRAFGQILTNNPNKAKVFESKMVAMTYINQHGLKLGIYTVTEHEFPEEELKEQSKVKNNDLCPRCQVPWKVHGTCCGWENAKATCNIHGIIIDQNHPGFGKNFMQWANEKRYEVKEVKETEGQDELIDEIIDEWLTNCVDSKWKENVKTKFFIQRRP